MLSFARDFGTGGAKPPLDPRDREASRRRLAMVLPHSLGRSRAFRRMGSRSRLAWVLPHSLDGVPATSGSVWQHMPIGRLKLLRPGGGIARGRGWNPLVRGTRSAVAD